MNIFVGNLPFATSEDDLRGLFEPFGEVQRASIVMDRATGRSRGFGFVEMASDDQARQAIEELGGKEYDGRALTVNEAKPRENGPRVGGRGPAGAGRFAR